MRLPMFLLMVSWGSLIFGGSITSITAKDSPLFGVEQDARGIQIDRREFRKYQIDPKDDERTAFRKLVFISRCLGPRDDFNAFAAFYNENAARAYQNFPECVPIVVLYSEARIFAPQESRLQALEPLIPFVEVGDQVPGIARIIQSILQRTYANLEFQGKQTPYIQKFVGGASYRETLDRLALMRDYWGARINPEYSKAWTRETIDQLKQSMTPEKIAEAETDWTFLIENIMKNKKDRDRINSIREDNVKRPRD